MEMSGGEGGNVRRRWWKCQEERMEMCKERRRDNLISHSLHFHLAVFVVPAIGGEVTRFTKGCREPDISKVVILSYAIKT